MSAPAGIAESRHYVSRLADAGVAVAGPTGARAIAFAACRGRRAGPRAMSCCSRPASALAIIVLMYALDAWEIAPDADARHAFAVVGPHPHRFRQGRVCAGDAGGAAGRDCDRCTGDARHPALAAAGSRHAAAIPVLRRAGSGARRRSDQMDRRPRPAVCRRRGQCLQLLALCGHRGLFELSVRPCHHRLCAGLCACRRSGRGRGPR